MSKNSEETKDIPLSWILTVVLEVFGEETLMKCQEILRRNDNVGEQ